MHCCIVVDYNFVSTFVCYTWLRFLVKHDKPQFKLLVQLQVSSQHFLLLVQLQVSSQNLSS